MENKTVLITGATAGIGKETAIQLAQKGASLIFNTRDPKRGEQVRQEIIRKSGNAAVTCYPCDLASFASIRDFAAQVRAAHPKLDVLINNAGVWASSRSTSKDGIEMTFAVNHLAPFLLTHELLPMLEKSPDARILTVSSALHARGVIPFDDLEMEKEFSAMQAYNNSKLANVLFTRELARRLEGTGITANCLHPGLVSSSLARDSNLMMRAVFKIIGKTTAKGAATSVYLASSPEVTGVTGEYFQDCALHRSSSASKDMAVAARLWDVSEQMCGISDGS